MASEYIKEKLKTLPLLPGCYQMKDANGNIIYVGKAIKLKNRVSSYFTGSHNFKTTKLVQNIADFDYIVTKSEKEALILEINLIKKYRPKYNIQFMDDSSYPYIELLVEPYPKLDVVRLNKRKRKGKIFGPYTDVLAARKTVKLLETIYPLRKCKTMPDKVCLYYHMGQCLGPCEYDVDGQTISSMAESIERFLKGDTKSVVSTIKANMAKAVEEERYEYAGECKALLQSIDHVIAKQDIEQTIHKMVDVFNCVEDHGYICINVLFIRDGVLLDKTNTVSPLYSDKEEALTEYIIQFYATHPLPKSIIVPNELDIVTLNSLLEDKVTSPSKGMGRQLLITSENNARNQLNTQLQLLAKNDYEETTALAQLKDYIGKDAHYFEIFDNSHISGTNAVAACVVWDHGFKRNMYRLYKVSHGADDLANMEEVFYRRYFRLLSEDKPLPDIVFVDGAENQMKRVIAIRDALGLTNVMILGLVKNDKHQTDDLIREDMSHCHLDKQSPLFFLLTQLQDEVHRRAVSFHQKLRSKSQTHSVLDDIAGLGEKRKRKLMNHFKSFKAISNASLDELEKVVPHGIAVALRNRLDEIQNQNSVE